MGVPVPACGRACCEARPCQWERSSHSWSSLTLKLTCPTSQTLRQAGTGAPAPITLALGPEPKLSPGWGIIAILCVSSQDGQLLLFISPHKSQARQACCVRVSVAGGVCVGEPSLPFLPPTPEDQCRVCLLARGRCSNFWTRTGERHMGDSALGRES